MKSLLPVFLLSVLFCSCRNDNSYKKGSVPLEFDSEAFFSKEAERLNKTGKSELKSAVRNGISETRPISRPDWQRELALFKQSVINKSSWKGKYHLVTKSSWSSWFTTDPGLYTKSISIARSATGKIMQVKILNSSANVLYTSKEELVYFPDSLYIIRKTQKVKFLEENSYVVTGEINN